MGGSRLVGRALWCFFCVPWNKYKLALGSGPLHPSISSELGSDRCVLWAVRLPVLRDPFGTPGEKHVGIILVAALVER